MTPTIVSSTAYQPTQGPASGASVVTPGLLNDRQVDKSAGSAAWLNMLQAARASANDVNNRPLAATNSSHELNGLAMKGLAVNAAIHKADAALDSQDNISAVEQTQSPEATKKQQQHREAIRHAQQLLAQTFFGPMLKQMRNSPFKSELFSGGRGGEAFASLFDQELTERMSSGAGSRLVNAIVRKLERRGEESMSFMQLDVQKAADEQAMQNNKAVQSLQQAGNTPGSVSAYVAPNLGN